MALGAALVWECRASGASDNNGGAYLAGAGTTDYSQQAAAQLTLTDLATSGVVTTLTSVTGGFTAAMVGNVIQIVSGTNFTAGFYQITAFTNGNTITLDRAPTTGVGSGGTGSVGGALATLGKLSGAMVANNKAYVTGAFTSTTSNVFAQTANPPTTSAPMQRLIGYGSVRGDSGRATLTLQTNTGLTGINCTGRGWSIEQIDVNCAALATSTGVGLNTYGSISNCKISNWKTNGIIVQDTDCQIETCELTGGGTGAAISVGSGSRTVVTRCWIHDNTGPGIVATDESEILFCIIANNSGASSDGIICNNWSQIVNNTIHNNGRHGINCNSGANVSRTMWRNNLLTNNGGFGIVGQPTTARQADTWIDGNAFYSNSSGSRSNMDSTTGIFGVSPYTNVKDVTLSASPYVGPTSGGSENFGLNNTAGGGAACRAVGIPGSFPGLATTVGYLDMGAVQHQDAASGGPIGPGRLSGGLQ